MPLWETLKHSQAGLVESLMGVTDEHTWVDILGTGENKFLSVPSESLWQVWGLILM